eukprot:jgi/Bigna1/90374/estExt_fgenesh1_pg.C_680075
MTKKGGDDAQQPPSKGTRQQDQQQQQQQQQQQEEKKKTDELQTDQVGQGSAIQGAVSYPETPRFDFGDEKERAEGLQYLEKFGYVVAKGVLNTEEVVKARSLFWDYVEGLPSRLKLSADIAKSWPKREDVKTWEKPYFPGDPTTGIISRNGAGQSPFSWFVRSRGRVKQVFSSIWDTDDLIVSFDGFGVFRPWSYKKTWRTKGGWYHVDQNPVHKPGLHCVQGLVSLYDQNVSTGGLTVIPGSQHEMPDFAKRHKYIQHYSDYIPIAKHDQILKMKAVMVSCRAGDLCLWDSRVVHCNTPSPVTLPQASSPAEEHQNNNNKDNGEYEKTNQSLPSARTKLSEEGTDNKKAVSTGSTTGTDGNPNELLRLVCYVCMLPTSTATKDVLKARKEVVEGNGTASHWPNKVDFQGSFRGKGAPDFTDKERYIVESLVVGKNTEGMSCGLS